jgi:hypothetical protein
MPAIITQHQRLDQILATWQPQLGKDFTGYRNHCYRVLNFYSALIEKSPDNLNKAAIAVAFHDLGIWSHGTMDYLPPSVELARAYLIKEGKEEWLEDVVAMIDDHHKLTPAANRLADAFRKADWLDVTLGILKVGVDQTLVKTVQGAFPDAGFHVMLIRLSVRNTLRHPLRPLPMFKW